MGEVYLAEDLSLRRKVALKVLPQEWADSPERRARFTREARALAALSHPNIVTVHSVDEADGIHFITMELVKGRSLRQLIRGSGLTLDQFFDIAIPLADAIASAHEIGIIHRDLKPDNVMIGDDGRLKVLDFGLAAAMEPGAETVTAMLTHTDVEPRRLIGTLAYMSPEQADGRSLDARSDLFSIGIVLHEMLTGRRPFNGDTASALLASISRDAPTRARELNPLVPRDLDKIVARCLTKDVSRRIQTAADIRNQLEEVKTDLATAADDTDQGASRSTANRWLIGVAATALIALATVVVYLLSGREERGLRFEDPVRLTTAVGGAEAPVWSPDGTRLAFESNQSGNWDIWVTQLRGGQAVNLTADHAGDDRLPSFSPDGSEIAFLSTRDGHGVFVMPALGGPPRKVIAQPAGFEASEQAYGSPQWSNDGSAIAMPFRSLGEQTSVISFSFATQTSSTSTFPGRCFDMSLSPDGRFIACGDGGRSWEVTGLWIVPSQGGERIVVSKPDAKHASPSWSADGRYLFYLSNRGGTMDLWRQALDDEARPTGVAERLTTALGAVNARFSPRSDRLAYARGQRIGNIWRVEIPSGRAATWSDCTSVTSEQAPIAHVDVSGDGTQLVFSSTRAGSPDLWLLPTSGIPSGRAAASPSPNFKRLTTDPGEERGPRFSSDGKHIAFHSTRDGNRDIWTVPTEGGPWRPLVQHPATDWFPTWSPDDTEIAFISDRNGLGTDIWLISSKGGEPRALTNHPAQDEWPVFSADGQSVFFFSTRSDEYRLLQTTRDGAAVKPLTSGPARVSRLSPDGKTLYFHGTAGRRGSIWAKSLETGREFPVLTLDGQRGEVDATSLATDGRYLYFVWIEEQSDIWVMNVKSR